MRCECKAVVNVAEVGDFSGALGLVEIVPDPEADKRKALVAAERKASEITKEKEAASQQEEAAQAARREGQKQLEEARKASRRTRGCIVT